MLSRGPFAFGGVLNILYIMFDQLRFDYLSCAGHPHLRPMLFDFATDPDELTDLGTSPAHGDIRELIHGRLGQWARRLAQRVTMSDQDILSGGNASNRRGILLGVYEATEVDSDLTIHYRGPIPKSE